MSLIPQLDCLKYTIDIIDHYVYDKFAGDLSTGAYCRSMHPGMRDFPNIRPQGDILVCIFVDCIWKEEPLGSHSGRRVFCCLLPYIS